MPKYNYAPVSTNEENNKSSSGNGNNGGSKPQPFNIQNGSDGPSGSGDELVAERMPMCIGMVILLAIVYVLSRAGDPSLCAHDSSASSGPIDYDKLDMGAVRAHAFARTPPHIIECASADAGCDAVDDWVLWCWEDDDCDCS
jgi:hypothetical protein